MMGMYGIAGTVQAPKRFWGEANMSKSLGYDDTLGDDESYKEAYKHFTKKLGLSDEEAKERLSAMGYIPGEKELVRLVENPKKFMEDYIQTALDRKNTNNDVLKKDNEKKELNPLVQKQLNSLKSTIEDNNLDLDQILDYLKNEQ
jgi:phosphoglycerol transferase MdoB-like AlkP superfamily enzyme